MATRYEPSGLVEPFYVLRIKAWASSGFVLDPPAFKQTGLVDPVLLLRRFGADPGVIVGVICP